MKKLIRNGQAFARKSAAFAVGGTALAASSGAFAIDSTVIDTAFTEGNAVVTTTVGGLIALTAIMLGIGIVMSLLKRA